MSNNRNARISAYFDTLLNSSKFPYNQSSRYHYDPQFSTDNWNDTMLLIYPEGRVVVDTGDSLDLVHQLKRAMFNPVVAYFGHSLSPGGDVDIGGTLIEDELFRRTNICKTLRSDAFYPISVGEAI
jgi:hypothetical protein